MYTGKRAFFKNFLEKNHGKKAVDEFEMKHKPLTGCSESLHENQESNIDIDSSEFEFDDLTKQP